MRCPIIVGSHLQGLARRMVVSIEVIHLVRLLRGTDLYQAIQNLEPVRLTTTPTSIRSDAAAISTTGRQGSVVTATSGSSQLSIRGATLISWVNYMTYWPNQPTPASARSLGLRRLATRGRQRLFANPFRDRRLRSRTQTVGGLPNSIR